MAGNTRRKRKEKPAIDHSQQASLAACRSQVDFDPDLLKVKGLIATAEARRPRLVAPDTESGETAGCDAPGRSRGSHQNSGQEAVDGLRLSGTEYATPVTIKRPGDDFVIAMVYGRRSDWVRNVMAADSVSVDLDGGSYALGQPEIVPMNDVADAFSTSDQRVNRLLAIDECVRLRRI